MTLYQRGVFWGVVPFTPAAPFSVEIADGWEDFASARELSDEFRRRSYGGTYVFAVQGKIRPLLAISEPSPETRDITALRLTNISQRVRNKLMSREEAKRVVDQQEPHLFHLRPNVVAKLSRDSRDIYAAILDGLVRINVSAITTNRIGEINAHEFEVLCTRLVEELGLDITMLVEARAEQLLQARETETPAEDREVQ